MITSAVNVVQGAGMAGKMRLRSALQECVCVTWKGTAGEIQLHFLV